MKTCHVCGCQVDDRELTCPDCGATVVMETSGLSLKAGAPEAKRRTNPIGTTVSTGSGLTDILRGDDDGVAEDDPYMGGSLPVSLTKTVIEEGEYKKKNNTGKVFGTVFKIILLAAVAYGVYYLIANVFLKKEGAFSYEEALDIYVEAANDKDADKMKLIVPPYVNYPSDEAQEWIDSLHDANFSQSDIIKVEDIDSVDLTSMMEDAKLYSNKTADIRAGVTLTVEFRGTVVNAAGNTVSKGYELDMDFIQIKDRWYFYVDTYDDEVFSK